MTKKLLFLLNAILLFSAGCTDKVANTQEEPLPDNLVAKYSFNGNLNDESKNGNNGVGVNVAYCEDRNGVTNNAILFNSASSVVKVQDSPSLDLTNSFTITAWLRPDTNPQLVGTALICKGYGGGGESYLIDFHGNNDLRLVLRPNRALYECSYFDWLNDSRVGKWFFVTATLDTNGYGCIYVDGVEIRKTMMAATVPNDNELTIGNRKSSSNADYDMPFRGAIDELRIYNRALSSSEINQMYLDQK